MKRFKKGLVAPLVVGIIAATVVFVDSLIAPLFLAGASSFVWISFISWNQFFNSKLIDRFKAIVGYIIGYLSANAMIIIGNNLENIIDLKLINISFATIIAVFIVNFLMMFFDKAKKYFLDSIPGIIVGIAITFAGAGRNIAANDVKLLVIIIVYGILGLLCGLATNVFVEKINLRLKSKQ